jgi:predicted PurR-regulated permease PerM
MTPPRSPESEADSRRDLYGVIRAIAILGIALLLLWVAGDVLLLVFAGILVAIFLRGMSDWVAGHTRLGNGGALAVVFFGILVLFSLVWFFSAPDIATQVDELGDALPRSIENLHKQLDKYRWAKALMDQLPSARELRSPGIGLVRKATGALSTTAVVLARVIVILFIGLFLALNPKLYKNGFLRLIPLARRDRVDQMLDTIGVTLRSWIMGKVLSGVAIGVATFTGLQLLGIPLALLLSVLAGLLSFIPNFGPILSMIPAVLLGLMQGIHQALYVVLLYTGIQVVETYLLTPWLEHHTAALPPALTIVMQILLGILFGGLGVIMAGPITAAMLIAVRMLYVEDTLGDRQGAEAGT